MANTLGRSLFSWALRQPVMDNQSGYRLISKRMMEAMLTCGECGFEFEVDMLVVCVERGFQLDWTPIRTIYGDQGSHISPLKHAWHFMRMVLQTRRRTCSSGGPAVRVDARCPGRFRLPGKTAALHGAVQAQIQALFHGERYRGDPDFEIFQEDNALQVAAVANFLDHFFHFIKGLRSRGALVFISQAAQAMDDLLKKIHTGIIAR
jgi:hypothetical protein